jgi:mRNA interferase MazF
MGLQYQPEIGTFVICDFQGFIEPEMVKRRPVVIVSPRFKHRDRLCTVVPLSTTEPNIIMPYHYKLKLDEPLPPPYNAPYHWVKGDMFATVSFDRLNLPRSDKKVDGKRQYVFRVIDDIDLRNVRECMLHAIDLSCLTKHL